MKIMIVTQGKIASGAEKVTSILYEDYKSDVLIVSGSNPQLEYFSNCGFETLKIESLLPLDRSNLGFSKITKIFHSLIPLRKIIINRKPNYVHVNNIPSLLYTAIASIGLKVKIVLQVHDFYSQDKLVKFISFLLKQRPNKIIAVSNSVKEDLTSIGFSPQNIDVVHNGIKQNSLIEKERELYYRGSNNIVRVLFIGSIAEWKGLHVLLKAAKKVNAKSNLQVEYYIVGPFLDKQYEKEIRSLAEEIQHRVNFMGKRSDIEDLMKQMDILVHCSIKDDPFPTVVLEGMSSGLAVIASTAGGAKEIITEKSTGMLHNAGDYLDLADKIELLIHDKNLRRIISANGLTLARKYLNEERFRKEFFNKVLVDKGSGSISSHNN